MPLRQRTKVQEMLRGQLNRISNRHGAVLGRQDLRLGDFETLVSLLPDDSSVEWCRLPE